jgi:hypothetical protein
LDRINCFALIVAATLAFTVSNGAAAAKNPTAANVATPPPPTVAALMTLEKSAYQAWKSKDARFWDTFLWDNFVGYGSSGKLDKASAKREYTGADCEIKSYVLSEEQLRALGNDAALLTYKVTVDGACGGQKVPATSWAAGVYVRGGDTWKGAFHAEAPVVDPKISPATPVAKRGARKQIEPEPAARDARTDAMLAAERTLWEAWRAHDGGKIDSLTARNVSFINIFGTYLATKADALKNWTGTGCDVKSVSVTDAVGTMLSPTAGILTFNGAADGTCYGQNVGPIWGTSIYVKDGDAWKWTFGINLPARP